MNPVIGFGGVKLSITVGATTTSVAFSRKKAYSTQPEFEPVGWSQETANHKILQKVIGCRVHFNGMFENVDTGDEQDIMTLCEIIAASQSGNIAMTLWPKWDAETETGVSYSVLCEGEWEISDLNDKTEVAQRIKALRFKTAELITEAPE